MGIKFWHKAINICLRNRKNISLSTIYSLLFNPMDSFRFFEFDSLGKHLPNNIDVYLDISSPRLFTLAALNDKNINKCIFLNPDKNDLDITKKFCNFKKNRPNQVEYINEIVSDKIILQKSVDVCTCISVIEHIPDGEDVKVIKTIWESIRPGGIFLLSLPCAKQAYEEYLNYNEYNLLPKDKDGFVFGQRFYDEELLEDRIFTYTGIPKKIQIYGELKSGYWLNQREKRFNSEFYPFGLESYKIYNNYKYFNSISDLPGLGVICMVFNKPKNKF